MNIKHRLQGRTDTYLNVRGRAQAAAAGKVLLSEGFCPDIVFSSPLTRVRQTIDACLQSLSRKPADMTLDQAYGYSGRAIPRVTDERLIEMSFGVIEGMPMESLPDDFAQVFFKDPGNYEPLEGAESYHALLARCESFLSDLRRLTREGGPLHGKRILAGTHGAVLHGMLLLLWHRDISLFWKQQVLNCAIIKAQLADSPEGDSACFISDGYTGEELL